MSAHVADRVTDPLDPPHQPRWRTGWLTRSKGRRVAGAVLIGLALLAPLCVAVSLAWSDASDDAATAEREREGVAYLQPLTRLIAELSEAQSIAVRGGQPSRDGITAAKEQIAGATAEHGEALGVSRRWLDVRVRVDQLATGGGTGLIAYERYTEVVDLALELARRVGDSSGLTLDPELDSYYLMDAGLHHLPTVIVESGRHADLLWLAANPIGRLVRPAPELITNAATAHSETVDAADAAERAIRTSVEVTEADAFGRGVVAPLDAFRSAVDDLPPAPTGIVVSGVRATAATQAAARVRDASHRLSTVVYNGLDDLLADRADAYGQRRVVIGLTLMLGVLAALAALWLLLPNQPRREAEARAPEPARPDAEPVRREPAARRSAEVSEALDEIRALLGARELLRSGELVRVGRAVRPGRREPDGDAK